MRRTAILTLSAVLLLVGALPAQATFRGRNGRIAYRRYLNDAQTRGALFTISRSGTGVRKLTDPGRRVVTDEPDWSPKGRWIVYQKENRYGNRLFKIRPNGSDRTYLSKGCGRFFPDNKRRCGDGYATWFPSGKRLALERELCGTGSTNLIAIYAMRADGTHDRRITHKSATCATSHRYADFAPTVAPSGKRLAFARGDNKRGKHAIFIVRLDGTRMRRVTPWWMDADQPDWAPNGRWITFRTQSESETKGNIALVHPNGKDLHRITNSGGKAKWLSNSFSPNGRRIVAGRVPGSGEAGRADLYVTKLDGSDRRNLTRSNPWESAPDWGPRRH